MKQYGASGVEVPIPTCAPWRGATMTRCRPFSIDAPSLDIVALEMRPCLRTLSSLCLTLAVSALALNAQTLRGTVTLPDSSRAANAIVIATPRSGPPTRTLTNGRGVYELGLGGPGRYELRVLRVGFTPTVIPALDLADNETRVVDVTLHNTVVALRTVTVEGSKSCRVNPDSALAVSRVWNEARTAILSSELNVTDAPLFAEWIEYDRNLDPTGKLVRDQRVRTTRSPTTHAFRSLPADVFAERGYIVADSSATAFYAPDADALLSGAFAVGHCLRLEDAPLGHPELIGVAFEPVEDRKLIHDIEGTFWVDRQSAELRSLEFRYTNLPDAIQNAGAGGEVKFLRLADGSWLVNEWSARLPTLGVSERITENLNSMLFQGVKGVVGRIHVTGGQVTLVQRNDSVRYRIDGPTLALQVTSRDPLMSASTASVRLAGTDYAGTADSTGRIAISPVLAGRYRALVQTRLMASVGVAPLDRDIEISATPHTDSIALPSAREFLVRACTSDALQHGEGMLFGVAHDEGGALMPNAVVTVIWRSELAGAKLDAPLTENSIRVPTNTAGGWRICGAPHNTAVGVRLTGETGADFRVVTLSAAREMLEVDLIGRRGVADAGVLSGMVQRRLATIGDTPLAGGVLDGVVSDANLVALSNSTITLLGLDLRVVTGENGHFRILSMRPTQYIVLVRHIGFQPTSAVVQVPAGDTLRLTFELESAHSALDTVRIMGRRTSSRMADVEQRRKYGQGQFLMADEIEKRGSMGGADLLRRFRGMTLSPITEGGGQYGYYAISSRGMATGPAVARPSGVDGLMTGGLESAACYMSVVVDGMLMPRPFDITLLPSARDVAALEVYTGPATLPPQFSSMNSGCGLIIVWTKDGM
jgi:hypothetical protein